MVCKCITFYNYYKTYLCFILTKWYVNTFEEQNLDFYNARFILTKWYVNKEGGEQYAWVKWRFILTKWYVNLVPFHQHQLHYQPFYIN